MLLRLIVVTALAAPPPDATRSSATAPPEATSSWDRADALAAEGRHDDAAREYARAWDELAAPPILYSWAQSERLGGRCAEAIALYERFLEHGVDAPPGYDTEPLRAHWSSMRANAQEQAATCKDALRDEAPPPSASPSPPPEPVVAEPVDPPARPIAAVPAKPWYRDAAGWSLFAGGIAVLATGTALVGVAAAQSNDADDRDTHQAFRDAIDRAVLEQRIGFAAFALGGALVLGAAVRWAVVTRRARGASRSVQLGTRGVGLEVRGRF
jgi:hypothetical protein